MPASSWSPGQCGKQWRTTKAPSAGIRLNATRFPGHSRAFRSKSVDKPLGAGRYGGVMLDVLGTYVTLYCLARLTLVEQEVIEIEDHRFIPIRGAHRPLVFHPAPIHFDPSLLTPL